MIPLIIESQTKANIDRIKLDRTDTSCSEKNDCINALTIVFRSTNMNE